MHYGDVNTSRISENELSGEKKREEYRGRS
jgi:hypothetical protein